MASQEFTSRRKAAYTIARVISSHKV